MTSRTRTKKQKGFTLIEALVATFMFIIVMVAAAGIFLSATQLNRKTDATRLAMETSRHLEEFLSKEVRNGQIDYDGPTATGCSGFPASAEETRLAIVNVDGDHECFYLGDASGNPSASGTNLWVGKNLLTPVKLNPINVRLSSFKVYVIPVVNPYCNNPPLCTLVGSTDQPSVTILGSVEAMPGTNQSITIPLQTSISLPVYDITN